MRPQLSCLFFRLKPEHPVYVLRAGTVWTYSCQQAAAMRSDITQKRASKDREEDSDRFHRVYNSASLKNEAVSGFMQALAGTSGMPSWRRDLVRPSMRGSMEMCGWRRRAVAIGQAALGGRLHLGLCGPG
ncbi:hypothetical protein EYF80_006457 [Liparis tanakae]|uniref:Uncharacterized protein n=1 Tax=Liparis tanakae TaxID=230148 RepID=A0A4Z2IZY7_9TELE|nr:hypothetical protein EYF80_006457 [Liparis tanakae]